ncbi:MAG: fumarate hydratase, partial [Alistipes sp.]|nr:fumarate hydratase [Alistipes sp.]
MADFIYQEPYPIEKDTTEYELVTKDYVKVVECDGRKILKVDPKGLELLSKRAYSDVSFYLRPSHLQKLANILEDPESSDNDKFVAYTMLCNQVVAAEGELPTCQDTGTAILSRARNGLEVAVANKDIFLVLHIQLGFVEIGRGGIGIKI